MAEDTKAEVVIGAQIGELKAGMQQASAAVKDSVGQIKGHFDTLAATVSKVQGVFLALTAVLAGGAMFKSAIDEFVQMNSEAKKLSVIMGTNIGDAQALLTTFNRFGVASDTVTRGLIVMTRQLKTNEDGFNANGIVTRDSSGNLLSMNEIMFKSIDRLKKMKEGTERNMLATTVFGRSVSDMPGFLKMSSDAVAKMKDHLASLGITLDDVSAAKAKAFKEGMHDVNLVFDALKYKIAEQVIPILIRMGAWFSGEGKVVVAAFTTTLNALASAFGYLASMMARTMAAWNDLGSASGSRGGGGGGGWGSEPGDKTEGAPKGTGVFVGKEGKGGGKGGGGGGESSIVAQWQNELEHLKLVNKAFQSQTLEMEKTFWDSKLKLGKVATKEEETALKAAQKTSEAERLKIEQTFWKGKLAEVGEGTKAYIAVQHKIVTLEGQMNKARVQGEIDTIKAKMEANKEGLKNRQDLLEQEENLARIDFQMKQQNLKHEEQMGPISKAKMLQGYRKYLADEQKEDLKREHQKLALYKVGEKAHDKHLDKIKILEKQHNLEIKKADDAVAKAQASTWGQVLDSVGNGFSGLMSNMMAGTTSITSALLSVLQSVGASIANIFLEMGMAEVKAAVMGTSATVAAAGTKVGANAAVGASGGFASVMSSLPWPLNVIVAPIVAAAAMMAIMQFIPKAKGGWDVPANSLAMLHAGEMVLPAHLADRVKGMTGGGGGGFSIGAIHIDARGASKDIDLKAAVRKQVVPELKKLMRHNQL